MLKEGLKPDDVAFVCILSACSQLGLVGNGCKHFNAWAENCGVLPRLDHFNCMVDLLGRAGCLTEAEDLLKTMPFHESVVGWRSLLNHCKSYIDVALGDQCHGHVAQNEYKDASWHVNMSNIYADSSFKMHDNKHEVIRRSIRASESPGEATIMVQKNGHLFIVGDEIHVDENSRLWAKLVRLSAQMKHWGYSRSLDLVLQPVFWEEEEDGLLHFSNLGCSS